MTEKIIDSEYEAGKRDFESGVTLRAIVEPLINLDGVSDEATINNRMSRGIGFLDGLLDAIRKR